MNPSFFMPKRDWKNRSPEQLMTLREEIFAYYREYGFPMNRYSDEEINKQLEKLERLDVSEHITSKGEIKISYAGSLLLGALFPNLHNTCKKGSKYTPYQIFNDDELFRKMIDLRLKHADRLAHMNMQLGFKLFPGVLPVNNFRAPAAAAIYYKYLTGADNVVWDMSGGFGARLLGAHISGKVRHYIACEPEVTTSAGLNKLGKYLVDRGQALKQVTIKQCGSEEFVPEANSLDLCFTSPPYFDAETYSTDDSQCYIKYPCLADWNIHFLRKTFENCYTGLKPGGTMLINVINTKYCTSLEENTVQFAKEVGFNYVDTLKLLGGRSPRNKLDAATKSLVKFEPVFVFTKS